MGSVESRVKAAWIEEAFLSDRPLEWYLRLPWFLPLRWGHRDVGRPLQFQELFKTRNTLLFSLCRELPDGLSSEPVFIFPNSSLPFII